MFVIVILVVCILLFAFKQNENLLKSTGINQSTCSKNENILNKTENEIYNGNDVFRLKERIKELEEDITKYRVLTKNYRRRSACHSKRQSVCEEASMRRRRSRITLPSESEDTLPSNKENLSCWSNTDDESRKRVGFIDYGEQDGSFVDPYASFKNKNITLECDKP